MTNARGSKLSGMTGRSPCGASGADGALARKSGGGRGAPAPPSRPVHGMTSRRHRWPMGRAGVIALALLGMPAGPSLAQSVPARSFDGPGGGALVRHRDHSAGVRRAGSLAEAPMSELLDHPAAIVTEMGAALPRPHRPIGRRSIAPASRRRSGGPSARMLRRPAVPRRGVGLGLRWPAGSRSPGSWPPGLARFAAVVGTFMARATPAWRPRRGPRPHCRLAASSPAAQRTLDVRWDDRCGRPLGHWSERSMSTRSRGRAAAERILPSVVHPPAARRVAVRRVSSRGSWRTLASWGWRMAPHACRASSVTARGASASSWPAPSRTR